MGNPQKLKFSSVDELLDYLPEPELRIVEHLRSIILDTLPYCTEKLSYNVPFYSKKGNICFIWPASIPWGNLKQGVALGFVKGRQLDPKGDHLAFDARKSVGRMVFHKDSDIDERLVRLYLTEAENIKKGK